MNPKSQNTLTIKQISSSDLNLLSSFILNMGKSGDSFRYFHSRPLSAISNHIVTLLGFVDGSMPIAYGHLDKDDVNTWLGVCVQEAYWGQGFGRKIVLELLSAAIQHQVPVVNLSVDSRNTSAIRLYLSAGFYKIQKTDEVTYMVWRNANAL